MRFSQLLIPTLKETPAEAEVVSHKLLLRAGFIRKLTSGVYTYLPLGLAAVRKVERIVREEMNRAGAQEILMPMVQPTEIWEESGRLPKYGPELLRFTDRHNRESCLGPTHEEVVTDVVRKNVHSYKQLPINLYQIQTKFRDEIRPRFGLMRGREFIMKDGYSFDADETGAEQTYMQMHAAYNRIFKRCGLSFRAVEADTGAIGGQFSHEFMVLADTGEDTIVVCSGCKYAANMEKATCRYDAPTKEDPLPLEKVATPGKRTVSEVTEFLGISPQKLVKTMIYMADHKPVAVLVRGDHDVQPVKLQNLLGAVEVELAEERQVEELTGMMPGYLGPCGLEMPIIIDREVEAMHNVVIGANVQGYHYINANQGRDFTPTMAGDIRMVTEKDLCPSCGAALTLMKGIEVGHIFKLGTSYSEAMKATFLDANGKECVFVMGCYGIGVSRIVAAAIEQNHDKDGMIFPVPIAPFEALLLNLSLKDESITLAAEQLYKELLARGVEVLLDDRDERPGIKFKDADLIGIPYRIMVGKNFTEKGLIEVRNRRTGVVTEMAMAEAAETLAASIANERQGLES